jgi:hypothetical protein
MNLMGTWSHNLLDTLWLNDWKEGPLKEPRTLKGKLSLSNRIIEGTLAEDPFKEPDF